MARGRVYDSDGKAPAMMIVAMTTRKEMEKALQPGENGKLSISNCQRNNIHEIY